jgi:FkbM family methyltransferase
MTMRTTRVDTPFGSLESFEGDHITEHLVEFGAYQRSDLAMLLSFTRLGDCVLDVGAHIGTFSIPLGRAVGTSGRVVAFEPVADHFELLSHNVVNNGLTDVVKPVRAVVANGASPLYVTRVAGNSGATSFSDDHGDLVDDVPIVSLDSWWDSGEARPPSVEVVKIDVEGMEYEVLSGGAKLIDAFRPLVHFEVCLECRPPLAALNDFFSSRGYRFFVNYADRASATDVFKLGHLRRVRELPHPHIFDVVAVDPASSRWPRQAASIFSTNFCLSTRAARARAGRLREFLSGAKAGNSA